MPFAKGQELDPFWIPFGKSLDGWGRAARQWLT
jgi:hypothetical protein